jgi:hypothetical protein
LSGQHNPLGDADQTLSAYGSRAVLLWRLRPSGLLAGLLGVDEALAQLLVADATPTSRSLA